MKEIKGNLWDFQCSPDFSPVVITTNCNVNYKGDAVMGKGIALEAKQHYPGLPKMLGKHIERYFDRVKYFTTCNLYVLPTKYNWWEKSNIELIEQGIISLESIVNLQCYYYKEQPEKYKKIYMVRPGCANGQLNWEIDVKPILVKYLDDRFIVVNK
jgi:hypothetical protein